MCPLEWMRLTNDAVVALLVMTVLVLRLAAVGGGGGGVGETSLTATMAAQTIQTDGVHSSGTTAESLIGMLKAKPVSALGGGG